MQGQEKKLRRCVLLSSVASTLSKCRPAAAEGAKLSTIRRGARYIGGGRWGDYAIKANTLWEEPGTI